MNYIKCGEEISGLKLKALREAKICLSCSNIQSLAGFTIVSAKTTYSELQIVKQDTANEFKNLLPPKFSNMQ